MIRQVKTFNVERLVTTIPLSLVTFIARNRGEWEDGVTFLVSKGTGRFLRDKRKRISAWDKPGYLLTSGDDFF